MPFTDFRPGDVFESKYRTSRLVRAVSTRRRAVRSQCRCGGCDPDIEEILVICVDAEEPVEVILKGGSTAKVLPVEEIELPEPGARVYRYGQLIYEEPE